MSWSVSFGSLEDLKNDKPGLGNNNASYVQDQYDAAKAAALAIVDSGAVGDKEKSFGFTLSGHANPDHVPKEGWSNDSIQVSIYQK